MFSEEQTCHTNTTLDDIYGVHPPIRVFFSVSATKLLFKSYNKTTTITIPVTKTHTSCLQFYNCKQAAFQLPFPQSVLQFNKGNLRMLFMKAKSCSCALLRGDCRVQHEQHTCPLRQFHVSAKVCF